MEGEFSRKGLGPVENDGCVVRRNDFMGYKIFRKLSNLKSEADLYEKILRTFQCSLQQKPKISLQELIQENIEIEDSITTSELFLMLGDSFTIGEGEVLPEAHIQRLLTRHIIDYDFLEENIDENTLIIISFEDQIDPPNSDCVVKYINNHEEIDEFKEAEEENQNTIYVTRADCSQNAFDSICEQIPDKTNYHQFRMVDSGKLEWVRSNSIDGLEDYRSPTDFIEQTLLGNYGDDNNTNIICANPGIGKSTLMKFLKNNTSPTSWTILIYPKDHTLYFRDNGVDLNEFLRYILDETRRQCKNSFEVKVLEALFKSDRVIFIWDGLDEVPEEYQETVIDIIDELSNRNVKQWVTARNNFKKRLEDRFNVLSRTIKSFNEDQQKNYVKNRLNCSERELSTIFRKIKKNINLYNNHSMVETPRRIYELTELLQNSQNPNVIDDFFSKATNQYDDTLKSSFQTLK